MENALEYKIGSSEARDIIENYSEEQMRDYIQKILEYGISQTQVLLGKDTDIYRKMDEVYDLSSTIMYEVRRVTTLLNSEIQIPVLPVAE